MDIHRIKPHVRAVIPTGTVISQVGCNLGLIDTTEGTVIIDTSISKKRTQLILDNAGVSSTDTHLVIYTHLHSDHVNGNDLLSCPVIFHSKAKQRMEKKCAKGGRPLMTFNDEYKLSFGDIQLHLMHVGGHTPESIIVWLPVEKVLFSGDLIFSGRAPFLASNTNFSQLIKALKWLLTLQADVIVPGHGQLCDTLEIHSHLNYLENTWNIIGGHVKKGYSLSKIYKDPSLPKMEGMNYGRNIEWIYKQLTRRIN